MKTKQSPLDTLVEVVAKTASVTKMKTLREALLTACDDVEEAFDALQAQLNKREFQYRALCTERQMEKLNAEEERDALKAERDALQAELEAVQVSVQHIARCQRGQFEELNEKLSRFKASTVADEITRWAEANYSDSHEAQAVVEGCYETEELEEFGSLEAFKKHAGIRDDYREDIIAMGGE